MAVDYSKYKVTESGSTPIEDTMTAKKETYVQALDRRQAEAQERIAGRGAIQESVSQKARQGTLGKIGAGLEVMGAPFAAVESTISNPLLAVQEDPSRLKDPIGLAREAALGATLQKRGQYGDILKVAGMNPRAADIYGLGLNIGGGSKIISKIGQTFSKIGRLGDKGLLRAGESLVNSTDEGMRAVGQVLDDAYAPVSNTTVEGIGFFDDIAGLPKNVVKVIEDKVGNIDDILANPTISSLRALKTQLGKFGAGRFGRDVKGLAETADDILLNKAYSGIKKAIYDTIKSAHGKNAAQKIMKADEAYTETVRAASLIKKTVVDPVLQKPTKAATGAAKLKTGAGLSFRTAMNTMRKASRDAARNIKKAQLELQGYNALTNIGKVGGAVSKAAIGFGVGGAALGSALGRKLRGTIGGDRAEEAVGRAYN